MDYAAHESRMNSTHEDGVTYRAYHEERARKGLPGAEQALLGPEIPEGMEYLYAWALDLVGRSGIGMNGLAPLRHTEIEAWSRNTGWVPTPEEVDGLLRLDAVIRNGGEPKKEEAPKKEEVLVVPPWPSRKDEG